MTIINMSGGKAGKPPVYQARTVQPTTFPTTVTPQTGYDALSQVTVNAPSNLLAQNIRKNVNIAGVVGTYEAVAPTINLQQKTVTPSRTAQTVTPSSGYDGLSQVTVNGDNELVASNIRSGVNIFGVRGTYTGNPPNPSTYSRDYSSSQSGFSTYPKIIVGPTYTLSEGQFASSPRFITVGNALEEIYQSGYFYHGTGGACVSTHAVTQRNNPVVGCSVPTWTNTNRDSSSMDAYLKQVAGRLGTTYFSGTLGCYVGGLICYADDGTIFESATMSTSTSSGQSVYSPKAYYLRNVPFTYSNGNVTYTLSTSTSGALGVRPDNLVFGSAATWRDPTTVYNARMCLFFHELFIEL